MNPPSPPHFQYKDFVRLRRDRTKIGVIWGERPIPSPNGWKYETRFDNNVGIYAEPDLVPYEEERVLRFGNRDAFLRDLVLLKLRQPLADNLYAAYASRTQFEVYQFKPALKFLGNPDQRLLIADEVGLGKTIEAGIIFLELQARVDMMRVLVLCPSGLTPKWRDELRSRFDENFSVLNADSLRAFIDDYRNSEGRHRLKGIVSLELARRDEFAEALAEYQIHFDLVIIDEAHHCRNTETQAHRLAAMLTDYADAMLLLTATPLQLGNRDLFNLLKILSPAEFDNFEAFEQRLEPNRYINDAGRLLEQGKAQDALLRLRQVENTTEWQRFRKNPYYLEVFERLNQPEPTRQDLITSRRRMLELNTLAHIFTRTRKREVQTVNSPVRAAQTLYVDFTEPEWAFYNRMIRFVRRQFWAAGGNWAVGFAVIMRERQTASCISAMREHFEELLADRYEGAPEDADAAQWIVDEEYQDTLLDAQRDPARELLAAARAVGETDTKFQVFATALRENFAADPKSKVLVFSFFRATLDYLYRRLSKLGYNLHVIHGGMPVAERQKKIEDFRNKPEIQVLLSSEVGSEGLDFQFCNTLFNYDLPWNPMKVEQRIGRLDRFGQLSPRVKVLNLVIRNSIEERIFLRLYERIGIFQESIGDLEAILGDVIRELSAMVFKRELTPEEESWYADHYADVIERRKQDLEEFESQKLAFMGQDAIFASDVEQALESGRYISEAEVQALVESYLHAKFPRTLLERNDDDLSFALTPDHELDQALRSFVMRHLKGDSSAFDFLARLAAGRVLALTYSAAIARDRKLIGFITIKHPLARAARHYWDSVESDTVPTSFIVLNGESADAGDYYFFIFLLHSHGLEDNLNLFPVVISTQTDKIVSSLNEKFLRLVQNAPPQRTGAPEANQARYANAEGLAKQFATTESDNRLAELQKTNDGLVNARLAALRQTFEIKQRSIQSYLRDATNPKIKLMREGQLRRVQDKYSADVQALEESRKVSLDLRLALAGLARIT